jgi:hypothetical protein
MELVNRTGDELSPLRAVLALAIVPIVVCQFQNVHGSAVSGHACGMD